MIEKIKAAALWVWNWITVLTATILGLLSQFVQYLDQLTGLDWSQVMSRERVALMVFWTAVIKGIVAAYQAQKAKQ
jgi:hypothetical protein